MSTQKHEENLAYIENLEATQDIERTFPFRAYNKEQEWICSTRTSLESIIITKCCCSDLDVLQALNIIRYIQDVVQEAQLTPTTPQEWLEHDLVFSIFILQGKARAIQTLEGMALFRQLQKDLEEETYQITKTHTVTQKKHIADIETIELRALVQEKIECQ